MLPIHTCAGCRYLPSCKEQQRQGEIYSYAASFSAPGTRRRAQTCRCVRLEGLFCRPARAGTQYEQLWHPVTAPEVDGFQAAHHGVRQDVFVQPAHSRHLRCMLASAQQSGRCAKVLTSQVALGVCAPPFTHRSTGGSSPRLHLAQAVQQVHGLLAHADQATLVW